MEPQVDKHICGVCLEEWLTEDEYNTHVCPKTNATPQQVEHLVNSTTPDFLAISQAAQERGAQETNAEQAVQSDAQPAETPPTDSESPAISLQ